MCVLYLTENRKDLQINYCIENLIYDIPKGEVLANLSLFITNNSRENQTLRLLYMKTVDHVRHLDPENRTDHEFLEKLSDIYGKRLSFNLLEKTVEFYCKPREVAEEKDRLTAELGLQSLELKTEYSPKSEVPLIKEADIPYTLITISSLPAGKTVFYSMNMTANNENFDHIIGGLAFPSINGTTRQLTNSSKDWKIYFDIPEERIIKPLRQDILIENQSGKHPQCYRLDANVFEEYIPDKSLAHKVAWFSSPYPQLDFSIEVIFPGEKATPAARHI